MNKENWLQKFISQSASEVKSWPLWMQSKPLVVSHCESLCKAEGEAGINALAADSKRSNEKKKP
jgi:hypothetical protein